VYRSSTVGIAWTTSKVDSCPRAWASVIIAASGSNRRREVAEEELPKKKKIHAFMRFSADFLTMSRFAIAAFIIVTGIFMGRSGFKVALIATLIGWISDTLDGFFARNSGGRVSRVARYDFPADMTLAYSFFLFMVITKIFPVIPALVLVAAGALIVLVHPTHLMIEVVSAPICALPIVLSFQGGWEIGLCYMIFLLALIVVRRERFSEDIKKAHHQALRFFSGAD
jgi:phosphatidylglycerophosphate synthase